MVENISDLVATLAGYATLIDLTIRMVLALKRKWKAKQPKNSKKRRKRKGKH